LDSGRRLFEESGETRFALDQRQGGQVGAVEFKEVEHEIDEACAAAIGGLHELERGHAIGADAAELAVEISGLELELCEGGDRDGISSRVRTGVRSRTAPRSIRAAMR
jgi:hypothetical protein